MRSCPECENPLDVDEEEVEEGDIVPCDECGTEYEVVSTGPLELARIEDGDGYDDEEDFLDEEEEEDE